MTRSAADLEMPKSGARWHIVWAAYAAEISRRQGS